MIEIAGLIVMEPRVPSVAHPVGFIHPRGCELLLSRFLPLENLQRQARRRVPCDVTMQQPGTRVVRFEGDDDVAMGWEQDHVSAGRILQLELVEVGRILGLALAGLLQQSKIVTVKMDLIRGVCG